ncbi:hypothetical protein PSACC_00973 [Paramicrosporidium saccamoebae]|uniref:Pentacotripeptide-repeat region of PRORP domain-containing protein n=1 Tax=Paramicrosporidium saccamoebae TaxID=1246581 RepID=A0A2H9TN96_9FUNG|nr:hypothetical protein PSACC_00973 [Paramicrosporidium saccamoebae]
METIRTTFANITRFSREVRTSEIRSAVRPGIRPEFLKLVAEVTRDAAKPSLTLAEGVDKFLSVLQTDASPILPHGTRPNKCTTELLALAHQAAGDCTKALDLVRPISQLGDSGFAVYNLVIKNLFQNKRDTEAWAVFNELCGKCLPSPVVCATMIRHCAKLDQVEKAFALHRKLTAQGMTANPILSSVLIFAASKRKEYFPTAIDIFRKMELLKMPIDIFVYNNLLSACAKAADLNTAMSLWQNVLTTPSLKPNVFTCTNYIWALASVETRNSKISKRDFVYEGSSRDLIQAVDEVRTYMQTAAIPLNSYSLSAMLAVYSNHGAQLEAEELFWEKYKELNLPHDPFSYELMFKLYDNVRNYEGAEKVYRELKERNIKMPYEGWRALARTAALYTLAGSCIILLCLIERERPALVAKFDGLCRKDSKSKPNPFVPWMNRSQSVGSLLKAAYGKDAPEVATKIVPPENK